MLEFTLQRVRPPNKLKLELQPVIPLLTELENLFCPGSTKMPRLRRWGRPVTTNKVMWWLTMFLRKGA